jgi:hypothetical protein
VFERPISRSSADSRGAQDLSEDIDNLRIGLSILYSDPDCSRTNMSTHQRNIAQKNVALPALLNQLSRRGVLRIQMAHDEVGFAGHDFSDSNASYLID